MKIDKNRIKESIRNVLKEKEELLKQLNEEPQVSKLGAEEDFSEEPHRTELNEQFDINSPKEAENEVVEMSSELYQSILRNITKGFLKKEDVKIKALLDALFNITATHSVPKGLTEKKLEGIATIDDETEAKEEDFSETGRTGTPTLEEENLNEVAPPDREEQVMALKKELPKTYVDKETGKRKKSNPWAVSWKSYSEKNK